jgi:hypothetical protein
MEERWWAEVDAEEEDEEAEARELPPIAIGAEVAVKRGGVRCRTVADADADADAEAEAEAEEGERVSENEALCGRLL